MDVKMWLKLVVLVVLGISIGIAQDEPACKTENTCDCCKGNPDNGTRVLREICEDQRSEWRCTYGCKDGYYGGKCYNICPVYCTRCAHEFGGALRYPNDNQTCYMCADGYYNGTGITNCSTPCPANCAENSCNKTSGDCLQGCIDGYYGPICQNMCPQYCTRCARYFGGINSEYYQKCYLCADGYYNGTGITNCSTSCPANCVDNQCNKTTGNCLQGCTKNWTGDKCDSCPDYCKNKVCDSNGGCTNGCVNEILDGLQCDQCRANGKYGDNCDVDCPVNCMNDTCKRDDGRCASGCKLSNFNGDKCDKCKPGYFGENCNNQCYNCLNGVCDRSTGRCTECAVGKFGEQCDQSCSYYCNHSLCYRYTGECQQGCRNGYSGDKCCVKTQYQGCEFCDTTTSCSKCKSGFYGNSCGNYCPTNCASVCDKEMGYCEACKKEKFYGDKCQIPCLANCLNGQCDKKDGQCTSCVTGFYGDQCKSQCSTNCLDDRCAKSDGRCYSCVAGFFGYQCLLPCPMNCLSDQCAEEDGRCMFCEKGYFGNTCEDICPKTCSDGECGRENGLCISCQVGYYGQTCNETCPTNCEGNICDQYDGICHNCTVGFYGNVCDMPCRKDCINGTCFQDSGVCAYGCINGCEEVIEPSPASPIGAAVGGSVGGICVITLVVVGVWFVLRRRRSQQETNTKYNTDELMSDINPAVVNNGVYENCDSVTTRENKPTAPKVVSKPKQKFDDNALEESHELDTEENEVDNDYYTFRNVIKVANLQAYVTQNAGNYLSNEFKRLAKGLKQPCTVATKSENIALNRYNGLYPYDHSRVKLAHDKMFFINACYIKGNQQQKAYIASLGPTKVTTDNFATFWIMVWYEKSDIIVMLTNLQEPSGMKCQQYWPELGQSLIFHDLEIKCDSMENFSEYTLRTFTVFKGKERRTVSQLHFTAWPDKSVPYNVTSLIEFRQRVKSTYTLSQGPVIVHCSAGVGRTGTYIAIDLLTEEGLNEGSVDVFGCIRKLREQRVNMVQTPDQYEYVHRAIVYTLTFNVDYTPTETFNEHVMSLTDSQYAAMHKKLSTFIEAVNDEHEQAVALNKKYTDKNRSLSDVPGNSSRPMLYLNRAFNDSDYINAVYVDGFRRKDRFILAQTPLSSTQGDFVCLIYQEKCSYVVSVEIADDQKYDVGCYIPAENESLTCGSFVVTCMKYQNKYNHQYRTLKITNNGNQSTGERIVHHYQYTNWKNSEKVPSSEADFVQFIKDTQASVQANETSPMLLHCLTGGKKCGLFCTVSLLLERADIIRQISVVNTVRLLRLRRPNVIPNKEQLKFVHNCVASQMEVLSTYTNFSM